MAEEKREVNQGHEPARQSTAGSNVTARIEADGREIVANLSDGRQLRADRADIIAQQLWNAGCRADSVTTPDWRSGDIAIGTQQQIVIRSYLRWREMGKSHEESVAPWSVLYEDEPGSTAEHQDILAHAARVMGSEKATQRWLNEPASRLNGQRPADLLKTEEGREILRTMLGRMEYGVYF